MCGRFANSETIPTIAARWSALITASAADWEPNTDIRPARRVPVLLEGPSDRPRRLGLMTWGWTRDFASSGKLINARTEDITTKRTFAEAVAQHRCLVPATAWFEWQRTDPEQRRGVKHLVRPDGLETWAIAGLWETTSEGGAVVLLTTAAHPSIAVVHDRMPVVISLDLGATWMAGAMEAALGLVNPLVATAKPA
jgi:putative SOS response-associated peptidase YedK